jgi:large subunit ribosomal protein L28
MTRADSKGAAMAYQCEFCDKKKSMGNSVDLRGKAKYLGGVGTKITGITRREFKPNLQRIKITTPQGENRTVRICTRCLKAGIVRKAVKQAPFKLPVSAQSKAPVPGKPVAKGKAKPKAAQ